MKGYISLSKREKRQEFFILLSMLLLVTALMGFLFLRKYNIPFNVTNTLELQMLNQKNAFTKQQKVVAPLLASTFTKIDILGMQSPQPFAENDLKNSINMVANSFENTDVFDTRKEGYLQIALFYKMYFDDKKIAGKKAENITLFEKQFEECSIGFKENEQRLSQKQNAILTRTN